MCTIGVYHRWVSLRCVIPGLISQVCHTRVNLSGGLYPRLFSRVVYIPGYSLRWVSQVVYTSHSSLPGCVTVTPSLPGCVTVTPSLPGGYVPPAMPPWWVCTSSYASLCVCNSGVHSLPPCVCNSGVHSLSPCVQRGAFYPSLLVYNEARSIPSLRVCVSPWGYPRLFPHNWE